MQRLVLLSLTLLFMGVVYAADKTTVTYDRISLSVSAEKTVTNDTVVAEMYSEREGEEASELASEVNQNIAWALDLVRDVQSVSAQTTGYYSQPVYREQTVIGWRVRQSIKLKSQDAAQLSQLLGDLQKRLAIGSLSYSISPNVRTQSEDELITQALTSFQKRAQLITDQLGRSSYRIVHIDVVTSGAPTRPVQATRMAVSMQAADSAAPPTIESGEQIVRVYINGTIELKLN